MNWRGAAIACIPADISALPLQIHLSIRSAPTTRARHLTQGQLAAGRRDFNFDRCCPKIFSPGRGESGWCSDMTSTHGVWRHTGVRFLLSGAGCPDAAVWWTRQARIRHGRRGEAAWCSDLTSAAWAGAQGFDCSSWAQDAQTQLCGERGRCVKSPWPPG